MPFAKQSHVQRGPEHKLVGGRAARACSMQPHPTESLSPPAAWPRTQVGRGPRCRRQRPGRHLSAAALSPQAPGSRSGLRGRARCSAPACAPSAAPPRRAPTCRQGGGGVQKMCVEHEMCTQAASTCNGCRPERLRCGAGRCKKACRAAKVTNIKPHRAYAWPCAPVASPMAPQLLNADSSAGPASAHTAAPAATTNKSLGSFRAASLSAARSDGKLAEAGAGSRSDGAQRV